MNEIQVIDNANESISIQNDLTADMFTRFVEYIDASEKTIQTYERAIRQFSKWLESHNINRPERADIIAYREELKESHKPSTVQNYIVAVRQFFTWLETEKIYPNIAAHIKGAKLDKNHKKDYLTSRQVKKVLKTAYGESLEELRNYAILALMFTGGLRTIEVSRANIEDIRTVGDQRVIFLQGKGHDEKTDYIKLMPAVDDAITDYLKTRGTTNDKEPLFVSTSNNSKGKRLSPRSISSIAKQAMVNAGYNSDKLTAHSTRHTAVTLALLGGESLQEVQQFARHSNITTTQIYAHNLDRAKNQCENTIAKAIFDSDL